MRRRKVNELLNAVENMRADISKMQMQVDSMKEALDYLSFKEQHSKGLPIEVALHWAPPHLYPDVINVAYNSYIPTGVSAGYDGAKVFPTFKYAKDGVVHTCSQQNILISAEYRIESYILIGTTDYVFKLSARDCDPIYLHIDVEEEKIERLSLKAAQDLGLIEDQVLQGENWIKYCQKQAIIC